MPKENDAIERNRPSEEGRNKDNQLRDDSDLQPGISTISGSETDDANQHLTRTAGDSFRTEKSDDGAADPSFDEIDGEK